MENIETLQVETFEATRGLKHFENQCDFPLTVEVKRIIKKNESIFINFKNKNNESISTWIDMDDYESLKYGLKKSKVEIECRNCGEINERYILDEFICNNCGKKINGTIVDFITKDCSICGYFKTNRFFYPFGECKKHNIGCRLGYYCEKFYK